jgi:hypothetical protein
MTLKNAALLALIGMILLTALLLVHFVIDIWGIVTGVVPAIRVLASLIRVLAGVSLAVFFWVFQRTQS